MSARQANEQEEILMGWPLGAKKQAELSAAINKAAQEKVTHAVGVWCAETGFALLVEIYEGTPVLWHCVGPCTVDNAKTWFNGMIGEAEREATGLMLQ